MTTQVTTKVPPGFDGKTSWFAFEDAIDDWCDITELEAKKWGPALRNRLEGEASVFKRLLDREELRQPNGRGVEYFKRALSPHFAKGAQTVFLYLSPNLIALIFISTADLSQDQRQSLTSIMTHRNRTMDQYRVGELRETFIEMFCTVKTAVDNPMMNLSGSGGRRAFLVLEEGDLDGSFGYWAEDEEDGAEGFLDALEDVFWIWDDNDYSWFQRRFQGR